MKFKTTNNIHLTEYKQFTNCWFATFNLLKQQNYPELQLKVQLVSRSRTRRIGCENPPVHF